MPQPESSKDRRGGRPSDDGAADRTVDHAAIDRLTAELLPALITKLGATGLGELEVREGAWRVRLRRPRADGDPGRERRPAERGTSERSAERPAERVARNPHHPLDLTTARTDSRSVATSPAVGTFQPRADLMVGSRIRAGDRLGAVDMLGIAQEVVAPVDGIVGVSLVEPGDAVEYGQELLVIEFAPAASTNGSGPGS